MSIQLNGQVLETDEEGYLVNLADWSEEAANHIAEQESVAMTPNHWEVVNFLREYYNDYQIAPAVRVLTKAIGKKLGAGQGQQQVPVRAVSLRPRQAGLQDRRPAEADRLRCSGRRTRTRSFTGTLTDDVPADARLCAAVLRRRGAAGRRRRPAHPRLRPHAGAAEDRDDAGADDRGGRVGRLMREVVLFESLFRSNAGHGCSAGLFHVCLLLVLLRHLRYFIPAGLAWCRMAPAVRRVRRLRADRRPGRTVGAPLLSTRVRYISTPSDHLMLALLLGIAHDRPRHEVRRSHRHRRCQGFMLGLIRADWQPLPADPLLLAHLSWWRH